MVDVLGLASHKTLPSTDFKRVIHISKTSGVILNEELKQQKTKQLSGRFSDCLVGNTGKDSSL
jgi:hypothetical protein